MTLAARFHLPNHVYICKTHDGVVFMNLLQDEYYGLDLVAARKLHGLVHGWPVSDRQVATQDVSALEERLKLADELSQLGFLTQSPASSKEASLPVGIAATSSQLNSYAEKRSRIQVRDVLGFLLATLRAWTLLRRKGIAHAVARVNARKTKYHSASPTPEHILRERASVFWQLRPWLFSSHNRCILESFALLEFLAGRGAYPTWIFGVVTDPFSAHCWIQSGTFVLNSTVEQTREFTPILTI